MATTQRTQVNDVVLIRHAQSEWNRAGRFTGWADPALTALGREEARRAAAALRDRGFQFDRVYSSRLLRARETATIVLEGLGQRIHEALRQCRAQADHEIVVDET